MRLFDTHCHLDDEQFDWDRDKVVDRATQAGVSTILAVGTTAASSAKSVALAARYDSVLAAVGIQPNYCAEARLKIGVKSWLWHPRLASSRSARPVSIGTGTTHRLRARRLLRSPSSSLSAADLPFIVHLRDCEEDILRMLREARTRGELQGVMHSYTGTAAGAAECIELGLHISFAGMVTYKKSVELREIAATIPDGRILIETDAPYLSPHPKRGQRPNEPALLVHTAACLAETRGTSLESFAELTTANANRLFNRPVQ